ncbi:substrate-binding domain-containing protein [Paenibacillus alvei]|uniref:substrate-binding domain-containing protein n=1 Tax=Paenibacillus alvei TaxID=44250 RepID=UPI0018CEC551|nr:substrate-binding domain-containing protein [Paenibacillus alvei]MBG9736411.1 LacI family transcriptional regulator [Paenibacillus alvei]MBG9745470.1 LacI family transcriptional regulator [Paenibacillus alvei]MCY9582487.1 substrate-binding domain-containing protein [Paenibacillus alvei]MCY9587279.1 substrate-binding domain-containing protein [Paenibacillus alvei]
MKRMNLFLVAILSLSFSLSSCSIQTGVMSDNRFVIDLIVKMNQGDYWNTLRSGAEAAAKEFNVKLHFLAPNYEDDISGQIELVNQSIQNRPDAVILAASDYMGLAQVTDRIAYHNIPIISIDSEVGSARVKTYVGTNNYEAGQLAAKRMIELIHKSGQIAVMNFVQAAKNASQREEGFQDYVARFPNVRVVDIQYSQSNQRNAEEITCSWLAQYPSLDGIVALNAESSIGVGREIQRSGKGGKVKVIAFDSPPETMGLLQDGVVQALVLQNPFNNGYLAVKYAVEIIEGRNVPERMDTGIKLIDLDNMLWPENQKLLIPFVK